MTTTREKILDLLKGYSIDTQDVLSGVAAHEARRLITAGIEEAPDELSWEARADLKLLAGHLTAPWAEEKIQACLKLYLADREELASTQRSATE